MCLQRWRSLCSLLYSDVDGRLPRGKKHLAPRADRPHVGCGRTLGFPRWVTGKPPAESAYRWNHNEAERQIGGSASQKTARQPAFQATQAEIAPHPVDIELSYIDCGTTGSAAGSAIWRLIRPAEGRRRFAPRDGAPLRQPPAGCTQWARPPGQSDPSFPTTKPRRPRRRVIC